MTNSVILHLSAFADETRQKDQRLLFAQWISVNDIVAKLDVHTDLGVTSPGDLARGRDWSTYVKKGRQTFYSLNQMQSWLIVCGVLMTVLRPRTKGDPTIDSKSPTSKV